MSNSKKIAFDNKERTRYYGLRIGDIIDAKSPSGIVWGRSELIDFDPMDNNSVVIKDKLGKPISWVAEWCDIVVKVEDIIKQRVGRLPMNYTTANTINYLETISDNLQVNFENPIMVPTNGTCCLMYIRSVKLSDGKISITDGRGRESEVNDSLVYHEFILKAICEEVEKLFETAKSEPWIN